MKDHAHPEIQPFAICLLLTAPIPASIQMEPPPYLTGIELLSWPISTESTPKQGVAHEDLWIRDNIGLRLTRDIHAPPLLELGCEPMSESWQSIESRIEGLEMLGLYVKRAAYRLPVKQAIAGLQIVDSNQ